MWCGVQYCVCIQAWVSLCCGWRVLAVVQPGSVVTLLSDRGRSEQWGQAGMSQINGYPRSVSVPGGAFILTVARFCHDAGWRG